MATVLVWSERNDPNAPGGAWRDCMYSSGLAALVFTGKTDFPLGMYSIAEREALERSDNQPDETGASLADLVVAVKNRYGVDWKVSSISLMWQYASRTDLGFVITGMMGNLPSTSPLRQWQPGFTGGHAWFIIPTGDGVHVRVFDPLATNKYPGDIATWADIRKFVGNMAGFILVRGSYTPPAPPVTPEEVVNSYSVPKTPSIAFVPTDTWLYDNSALQPSQHNMQVNPGRDMPYLGQPNSAYHVVEYVDAAGVHSGKAMFIKTTDIKNIRPLPDLTPFDQADLNGAYNGGLDAAIAAVGHLPRK